MELEKIHMRELQRIEEEISRQRVEALVVLEHAAQEEMEMMDKAAMEAQQVLRASETHLGEKMALAIQIQKHRELAEAAEAAAQEKLRRLHMRRAREEVRFISPL